MERAKDLNGLLTLLQEATQAVGSVIPVLAARPDTESQAQRARLLKIRDSLEFIGRDLVGGVIDLRELPFDEPTWSLLFKDAALQLASEKTASEEIELTERAVVPAPPTDEQEDLFDYDTVPGDHGLGIPPDLLDGIDTDAIPYDDAPTVPILLDGSGESL
jgi:hypothetical protein